MTDDRATAVGRDFDGRVVLVTGGGSGIGRAAAERFAARGARVAVADRDERAASDTAATIEASGGVAMVRAVDVADRGDVRATVDDVVRTYGRLDAAFNCAGVSEPLAALHELDPDVWQRTLSVNLSGVLWCLQAELARFVDQGDGGAIVNASSGAGIVAAPMQPSYTAAKHGVLGLTKVAAQEYARQGIRVNAVLPGTTDTPMLRGFLDANPGVEDMIRRVSPTGELGRPEQVAEAAVWMCSDAAAYVNGASLVVDGGAISR